jgi:hypothetical protein
MEATYCPVCGWDLQLTDRDAIVDRCPCCWFNFIEYHEHKRPFSHFHPKDSWADVWRVRWIEAGMAWGGEPQAKPPGWDPIKQMNNIDLQLADSYADWMEKHPRIIPANKDKFLEIALHKLTELDWKPEVVEAMWSGDTQGWFLVICVSTAESGKEGWWNGSEWLLSLRGGGGDFRLFAGSVPPWPESIIGQYVGEAISEKYGIPFYFPAPDQPCDDYADWWERDESRRCTDCGRYLTADAKQYNHETKSYHLKTICYLCWLRREQPKPHSD